MLEFITNLLMPIFTSMGVSETDVTNYVNQLSGYIYAILITLIIMIAVMIGAHWFSKKGTRHVWRFGAGCAWVLIVLILANVICFGPMYNNLAPILNGRASVSEESIAASEEIIKEVGEEGIALLENDGVLPLAKNSKLNVFGWASTNPIYGGTGSGSADNTGNTDILTSLADAGFEVNQEIIDMYTEYSPTRDTPGISVSFTDWSLPEPPVENYTDELMENAKDFSDTAMIVLARSGGEGQDEPFDMNAVANGTYDPRDEVANGDEQYNYYASSYVNNSEEYDDFEPGETYLELSKSEKDMIDKVTSEFDKVFVVVNANNPMELGWVNDYEQIGAVLLVPGTGKTGMAALGEVINGDVNPSGRTAETFVYDLKSTPAFNNYGNFTYTNMDDVAEVVSAADEPFQGAFAFVNYVESIYVGYRFYETADAEGFINYDEVVQYPFGHGLSYTEFTEEITNFSDNGDSVSFDVVVTNTGDVAGKDVVEIYYTPPYNNGGIEKSSVNLINFEKTDIIEAGESETISFEIAKEDMASFDSSAIKTANGGYILEAGEYIISVRKNSHTVSSEVSFTVDEDISYEDGRESDDLAAVNQFDYALGDVTYLSRADAFANYEEATAAPTEEDRVMPEDIKEQVTAKLVGYYDPSNFDNEGDEMPTTGADNGLKLEDFVGRDYDDPEWEDLLDQLTVEEMIQLVNLGGFQTVAVESVDKMAMLDSDGTSGLNDWYIQVYGSAYPTELLIAMTWNKDLARRVGEAEGAEYADARIFGTYSPAMNTHRTAFNGRNFEYYSEDGILGGYMALNTINGLAEKKVYPFIKHFVMNDQEINRCSVLQTYSTEQAMREIYLKPFEICVKEFEGESIAVMSSFNYVGPVATGASPELLNTVLRDEWGFRGMVLSDWNGSYGYQNTEDFVRNGNDVMLGFNQHESNVIEDPSATTVIAMRQAAKNIFYTTVNSGNYTTEDPNAGKMPAMNRMFIIIDVCVVAVLAAIMAIVLVRYKKKNVR